MLKRYTWECQKKKLQHYKQRQPEASALYQIVFHCLRVFFKYDRKFNTILFKAAWGALSHVMGIEERELAAIFTVQTAGEALNYHPHLHGLLADEYWKDGVFTSFGEVDLKAIEEAFAERVLAHLHKQELITDDDVAQILSQDHTGFSVPAPPEACRRRKFDALEFLAALSCHVPKTYESITRYYGRYSRRRRGERAKLAPHPPEEQESDYRREFRKSSWAACIKRINEIDPLECPKCNAQMSKTPP